MLSNAMPYFELRDVLEKMRKVLTIDFQLTPKQAGQAWGMQEEVSK